ncbi:MAG: cytochrome P450 [Sphingomonadales bacterium]|nr:cytochrome P450 [Sphingomonadales bacterium]
MFLVLSYDLCAQATGEVDTFSNNFQGTLSGAMAEDGDVAAILSEGWPQVDTLLTADPPVHTRFRKLVNLAFSMKRVAAIEEDMRGVVIDLIDRMAAKGEADFVQDFGIPLPVAMIASQIGMTNDDLDKVKRWSDAFVDRLGRMIPKERELECAREVVEFQHFVKAKIDERRANRTDDLLSDLVYAEVDGERPLEDAEILSIMQQLMVAGNETTTSALAGGLLQLIENPDQMAKAVAAADEGNERAIINLVEEVLRIESPTAGMWRMVLKDAELGGVAIPKGAMVQLRYAAANRDPAKYPDPDRFDMERTNARSHLAFGKGIHMCVGNMLSRKEMAVAYSELLTRLTDFRVAEGHTPSWPPNMLLRGLTALPITFRRRA